jgi:hypothetical protein
MKQDRVVAVFSSSAFVHPSAFILHPSEVAA